MNIISPMRPGVNLGSQVMRNFTGWIWQPKIDDERAVIRLSDGAVFNRHGQAFDRTKVEVFEKAIGSLLHYGSQFRWIDCGLIGFRDSATFKAVRGSICVYDLPDHTGTWVERSKTMKDSIPISSLNKNLPGAVFILEESEDAMDMFTRSRLVPGFEGIVGRRIAAAYEQGESKSMAKARWKRG